MRILSLLIIYLIIWALRTFSDPPHGPDFKISCNTCHSPEGWHLDKKIYSFNHNTTRFPLAGQHTEIDCKMCHPTLIFRDAKAECNECHIDVHQSTVGLDCSRCHTPASWLVNNITDIHIMSRFPLLGAHRTADCYDCHKSESLVRFDVVGVNCIDCHRQEFLAAENPDHVESGFSEDCSSCHSINSFQWTGAGFNHSFFPLVLGHATTNCVDCHTTGRFSDTSPECRSCHEEDYTATANPNHTQSGFPTTCENCHTLSPGWRPASFDHNNFPIYSGSHKDEWNSCNECHTTPSDYSQFSCISCHEHNKTSMDREHSDENGYSYDSESCYRCHPRGEGD